MTVNPLETAFTRHAGVRVPIICGAMYPCSNPELVGAASRAGALGIVQPISLRASSALTEVPSARSAALS